jgi:citrate lyase subunit beta/citryl-CoA lyase
MRSLLFVPGDDEAKIVKAFGTDADVVILDLEDSVAPNRKNKAGAIVRDALDSVTPQMRACGPQVYVRVNPLGDGQIIRDVEAVLPGRPNGIMLPKCQSGSDAGKVSEMLVRSESEMSIATGTVKLIAIMTETASSLFAAGTYENAATRLIALTWGAEDLSADIGAQTNKGEDGRFLPPYELARSLCLLGAAAAKLDAIDTVFINFRDAAGLKRECADSIRDGFSGKMAIHPAQVPIINDAFTPLKSVAARARAVVAGFEQAGGAGVIAIDGEMVDRPHLVRARKILSRVAAYGEKDDPKPTTGRKRAAKPKTATKRKPATRGKSK